jgi:periplasmic divalent cation tolerance protein
VSRASIHPTRDNTAPPGDRAYRSSPVSQGGASAGVQVQFTIDDPAQADALVDDLLDRRLVACGQRMGPFVSRYWWRGAIEEAEEWMVVLKTRPGLVDRVFEAVLAVHPYETPEVVSFDVSHGAPDYLRWIGNVTADPR